MYDSAASDGAMRQVARNLELDAAALSMLMSTGLSLSGMLGVAYLSKAAGVSIAELVEMRRAAGNWSAVSRRLGFPMDFEHEGKGEESAK